MERIRLILKKNWIKKILVCLILFPTVLALLNFIRWQAEPGTVYSSNYRWGMKYYRQGDIKTALSYVETAAEQVAHVAPNTPDHTQILFDLCLISLDLGEYQQAEKSCQKTLSISKTLYGSDSLEVKQIESLRRRIKLRQHTLENPN